MRSWTPVCAALAALCCWRLAAPTAACRRVPARNGERVRNAPRGLGKPVEWVYYPDEGHGFWYLANRVDHYRRVESFLDTHLK